MLIYYIFISLDGAGNWSTEGCRTIIVDSISDLVMCECDHLTNFASLVVSFITLQYNRKPLYSLQFNKYFLMYPQLI